MWIARDKNGLLYVYRYKPFKGEEVWIESPKDKKFDSGCIIQNDCFPEVKWEDEEPRELILKPINKE